MSIVVTNIPITNGGNFVYTPNMVIGSSNDKNVEFIRDGAKFFELDNTSFENVKFYRPIDLTPITDDKDILVVNSSVNSPTDPITVTGYLQIDVNGLGRSYIPLFA